MGRSLRSKRALMLRAAKAAALDELHTNRIKQLNTKLQHNLAVQNRAAAIPENIPENVTVTDIDTQYKVQNIIDLRAEKTMSSRESAIVPGNRIAQQFHVHPAVDTLRSELKPLPYKPTQLSYYISPTEATLRSKQLQSTQQLKYAAAALDSELKQVIDNEDKDAAQHIKIRNIKKRVRDADAMELDNELGRKLGNLQYIDKYGGQLDGNVLPERKRQRVKLSSKDKRLKKSTNKLDLFRRLGKYSGRGKM